MKVYNRNHVYRYLPDYLNNRRLPKEQQVVIKLRSVSAIENDDYQRACLNASREFSPDRAQELNEARFNKLAAEKYAGCEGLEIEGMEGRELDFETFYAEAPQVLVNEALKVIMSSEMLTLGEQKNFVPESDSPSLPPATA